MKQRRLPSSWKPRNSASNPQTRRSGILESSSRQVLQTSATHSNVNPRKKAPSNGHNPPVGSNRWRSLQKRGRGGSTSLRGVQVQVQSNTNVVDLDAFKELDDDALVSAAVEVESRENADESVINGNLQTLESESQQLNQIPAEGFNTSCGGFWVYPVNKPVRDYQYEIVEKALFNNTMVVLPTGLGKTFIAAVVMYNFHRWFPSSKVIFLAPTKPLVAQQISACSNIMGLKKDDIVELTGAMSPVKRDQLWLEKQLFFLTPQTMSNDLLRAAVDPKSIRLLVIDEAHKARGSYAYCTVVTEILKHQNQFRVLALTATPGSETKVVQDVVNNLKISHIESRSEQQLSEYCHDRNVQKHVVALEGPILEIRTQFLGKVLMPVFGKLRLSGVLWRKRADQMSRFDVLTAWNKYREQQGQAQDARLASMMHDNFNMGMILFLAWEFLNNQGLRSMYCYLRSIIIEDKSPKAKKSLLLNADFMQIFSRLKAQFEGRIVEKLDASLMLATQASNYDDCDNDLPVVFESDDVFYSHPKLKKLENIILDHFRNVSVDASNSRVIVFSTYRESVHEITELLLRHKPMIKAMSFIGQGHQGTSVTSSLTSSIKDEPQNILLGEDEVGLEECDANESLEGKTLPVKKSKGLTQTQQKRVIEKFKSGHFNVLVSTCVGEEGLDIGEVDLIINYDNPKSIVRLIQRAGRTGRKRHGTVHAIMTEGKEQEACRNSLNAESKLEVVIQKLSSGQIKLCHFNPTVIPADAKPAPLKLFLNPQKEFDPEEKSDDLKNDKGRKNQAPKRSRGKKRKGSPIIVKPEPCDSNPISDKLIVPNVVSKEEISDHMMRSVTPTRPAKSSATGSSGTKRSSIAKELKTSVCKEDSEYLLAHQFFPLSPGGMKEWHVFNLGSEKASLVNMKTSEHSSGSPFSKNVICFNISANSNCNLDGEGKNSESSLKCDGIEVEEAKSSSLCDNKQEIQNEEIIVLADSDESLQHCPLLVEKSNLLEDESLEDEREQQVNLGKSPDIKLVDAENPEETKLPVKNILTQIRRYYGSLSVPMFEESSQKTFDLKFDYCFKSDSRVDSPTPNNSKAHCSKDPMMSTYSSKKQVAVVTPMQQVSTTSGTQTAGNTCFYNSHNSWILESKHVTPIPPIPDDPCSSLKRPQNKFANRIHLDSSAETIDEVRTTSDSLKGKSRKRVSFIPPVAKKIDIGKAKSGKSKKVNRFILDEAEAGSSGGSDEESAVWNTQDVNFLASQPVHDRSNMKYIYMRSIRSPKYPTEDIKCIADLVRRKRPVPLNLGKPMNRSDIFSQQVNHDQSSYMKGSFIVDSEDEIEYSSDDESNSNSSLPSSSPEIGKDSRKRRSSLAAETPQHRKRHRRNKFKRIALESSSSEDE